LYQQRPIPSPFVTVLATLRPDDAERVAYAFQFAAEAHGTQQRDEGTPFIDHPVAVAVILWSELGCRDVDMLLAALAHDILEDCVDIDADVLVGVIGAGALDLVRQVTKAQVAAEHKAQRDQDYLDHLRTARADVRLLKLADRIHNLRSIVLSDDRAKALRYLTVSRDEFYPMALATDITAAQLVAEACDAIERFLKQPARPQS
jgi:(p)ppGpp synthase/HD superfamily hydrolase